MERSTPGVRLARGRDSKCCCLGRGSRQRRSEFRAHVSITERGKGVVVTISNQLKRWRLALVALGILGALGYWQFATRLPPIPQRPLRIGFEPNPPFQIRTDGGFGGLAIEVVNEA